MLKVRDLSVNYGGIQALDRIAIHVAEREFISVIGANGAGKTTLFKSISGAVGPTSGTIEFMGQDLGKVRPCDRPHLGIAHVPEGRQVFPSLSVFENLEIGAHTAAGKKNWKSNQEMIFSLFPRLLERREQLAGTLSGGEQQMLAIARGLASSPRLLMLDEPSMGLAPSTVEQIFERIRQIHTSTHITILLVEQRVAEALEFCSRGYVLESGTLAMEGQYEDIMKDDRIRQAYLGS